MNVRVFGLVEGLMVVWDEVKNAAQYHVHLFIGDINKHLETIDGRQTWVTSKEVIKEIQKGKDIVAKQKIQKEKENQELYRNRKKEYCVKSSSV